jgi:crotonobetainyl-CoA:carnitine CoA-transferase CaiB-like acyl-CoA transferase
MRPQALQKLGIDADSVRSRFPEKIYCLITGYGTDGPYAGLPTYDSVVQGVTGMAGLFMQRDGAPNYVPMLICDHVAGEIAAGAILAAVIQQQATGQGCTVEVPMFETMAAFVLQEHLAQHSFDPPVGPPGDRRLLSPHNKPVQTADGWISFTVNTDPQVKAFLKVTGRDELIADERFNSVGARAKNVQAWFEVRGKPLTDKTTEAWLSLLQQADIAAQPCHTLETLPHDKHLKAVNLIQYEEHPTEGRTAAIRASIKVDDRYLDLRAPSQPKGWESEQILADLGYSSAQAEALQSSGSVLF